MNFYNEARELIKTERSLNSLAQKAAQVRREITQKQAYIQELAAAGRFSGIADQTRQLNSLNRQWDRVIEKQDEIAANIGDRLASLNHAAEKLAADPSGYVETLLDEKMAEVNAEREALHGAGSEVSNEDTEEEDSPLLEEGEEEEAGEDAAKAA
ncbi:hypothetical protein [Parendozoicomonas haliclonae]|uniref:Uncharacterized protein n=1 Tax=Parendozoicomonas haliclonae TaxID=1960125 RepID=A0A1X7AED6_9GAMM|nr:hypothetical protein [Parendozoicomonas haliclonae]SMA33621.1 hypothetical protein EHSB41UT_00307 [Parendozoicomonas haliclonae]